ncbi:MAG TPA: dienelactone hydrolase family protein [Ktedonobacterales bacterium]|nr:dienelactone hydrolase family protein [Ktedonobacterales bacterium]
MITFPVGEGTAPGYLALPKSGEGPGVLVLHAWWGLNDFFKAFCDRLAQEGYVALAPDVYHGKIATTIDEAQQIRKTFESEQEQAQALAELTAAVTYLRQHPAVKGQGIACVGFSMGGWSSYELSVIRPADVVAVAAFYGVGDPAADYSAARAAYLGQYVLHDEWEEDEYVDLLEKKLRADGREATFYRYPDLSHWFMEDNRPDVYNAEAARVAWERLLVFLSRHLTRAA